jgi:hypothetical protein
LISGSYNVATALFDARIYHRSSVEKRVFAVEVPVLDGRIADAGGK